MSKFKGSKTEENIKASFRAEGEVRTKYGVYAEVSRVEGNTEIAELFEKMEQNERQHAEIWYKMLHGVAGDSMANLKDAANGENEEWKNIYPGFAKVAREEGFRDVADLFEKIASIEYDHERRFTEAVLRLSERKGGLPQTAEPVEKKYYCVFCGHMTSEKLDKCPLCQGENSFTL